MSFRDRLALFLVVMLVVVQALTAAFTYSTIRSSLVERGKHQLATATTVLMKQLDVLGQRVGDDVEVLSLDYALRKAVAEHDPATALSALRNHGNRVGATRMSRYAPKNLSNSTIAPAGMPQQTGTRPESQD